jgi:hypothetical protein
MCSFLKIAEGLGGLATVGTLIVALCALKFAREQISEAKNSQREATAKDIYRDYLELAFNNPKFANPAEFINGAGGDGWKQKGEWNKDERYRWFVSFMLNSCDEIAQSKPGDESWRKTIFLDLQYHQDYLKSPQFVEDGGWNLYSPELKNIVDRFVKQQTREGDGLAD